MWHNPINITVLVRPFFLLQLGIHYSSEDFFFVALVPRGTTDYNLDMRGVKVIIVVPLGLVSGISMR